MFTVSLLPAARGDCLWIEYGRADDPHRVLIDGGIKSTSTRIREHIEKLPEGKRHFDLLVITHIDLDHIAGVLQLLRDPPRGLQIDDVWFNGWEHLLEAENLGVEVTRGAKMGESVSTRIKERGYPWNSLFGGHPVAIPDDPGTLPRKTLAGGMSLTLLSPTADRLRRLRPVWDKEVRAAGLEPGRAGEVLEAIGHPDEVAADARGRGEPRIDIEELANGPFQNDTSEANGSSIALLAEFGGKRCLLSGDAYASDLAAALRLLMQTDRGDGALEIDALKLSHHGGRKSTSRELLRSLRCRRYLFSTDGSVYKHPHLESVARVVVHGAQGGRPTLFFNYRSDETGVWDDAQLLKAGHPYEPNYLDSVSARSIDL